MQRTPLWLLVSLVLVLAAGCAPLSAGRPGRAPSTVAPRRPPTPVPTRVVPPPRPLLSALTPWQLPDPLSRAVVLSNQGNLVVAGGLEAGGQSSPGIIRIQPRDGSVASLGTLPAAVHDAAGAMLGGRVVVFGGGSASSIAAVQALSPGAGARVVSRLPLARSDLTSVVAGGHAYLLGGYDGTTLDPSVLSTADGIHFRRIAQLPISVRYAAAAALAGHLYIFGGLQGAADTSAIQDVNLQTDRARVAGRLPTTLSHATAVVLGQTIYLAGGRVGATLSRAIWRFDPHSDRVRPAGALPLAIADAGGATVGTKAYLVGGEDASGPLDAVIALHVSASLQPDTSFPFHGRLLIADRGNNRLLVVDTAGRVLWTYPSAAAQAPPGGFYFPDDAFFSDHGRSIVLNEEQNEVILRLSFPSGRVLWSYGHPGVAGSDPGYLHEPDDTFLLKNGEVTVADAQNCRVLFLSPSGRIVHQIGTTGLCVHQPPDALGSPNGDTPLHDGDVLISEINGSWISEYTPAGRLVWTVSLPISYPSDPQQIGPDRYLVADYTAPGGLYEFNRAGTILWSYRVAAGPGMLDHPSLAERLPNGLIIANDDYRHRVVVINPVTNQIVWQYGQTDVAGSGAGYLNTPDGLDLLSPQGGTPTHSMTR